MQHELPQFDPATPSSPEGVFPDIPTPSDIEAPEPDQENPLVAGRMVVEFIADLNTTVALEQEFRAFLTSRLGGAAVGSAVEVTWRHIEEPGEATPAEPSPEEAELRDRLDVSIDDALAEAGVTGSMATRCSKLLWREGITNMRALLAAGRTHVKTQHNLGKGVFAILEQIVDQRFPGIEWKGKPVMADIVALCPDLDSVPGVVINCGGESIQQILSSPVITLEEMRAWKSGVLAETHEAARVFAAEFLAEKAKARLGRTTTTTDI